MFVNHYLEPIIPSFADIVGALFPIDRFPTRHFSHLLLHNNHRKGISLQGVLIQITAAIESIQVMASDLELGIHFFRLSLLIAFTKASRSGG